MLRSSPNLVLESLGRAAVAQISVCKAARSMPAGCQRAAVTSLSGHSPRKGREVASVTSEVVSSSCGESDSSSDIEW